ncbi:aldolase/citrate lyase family protein [Oscillospiraceae bacterium PP1C4]
MSRLKEKLTTGQVILGTMLSEITTPNIARILEAGGFEYIIVDCEHGYFDYSQTASIVAIANGIGLPVIVRIPKIDRDPITKYMDMGADGILVPMTNTAQDARAVVDYVKYAPLGHRGVSTTRAHTNYNPPPLSQYTQEANKRTIVMVQIETRQAVHHIREILAVDGVDAAIIGPNDLAMDLGVPGDFTTQEMSKSIETVIETAKQAGKACGIIASDISFLQRCRELGMTVFSCNSEVGMMIKAAKGIVSAFHQ